MYRTCTRPNRRPCSVYTSTVRKPFCSGGHHYVGASPLYLLSLFFVSSACTPKNALSPVVTSRFPYTYRLIIIIIIMCDALGVYMHAHMCDDEFVTALGRRPRVKTIFCSWKTFVHTSCATDVCVCV